MSVTAFFDIIDVDYTANLLYNNMDRLGGIKNHPTALKEAYQAGREIVRAVRESLSDNNA